MRSVLNFLYKEGTFHQAPGKSGHAVPLRDACHEQSYWRCWEGMLFWK